MSILVEDLSKKFGTFRALDHVNLEIKTESLVALVVYGDSFIYL